MAKLEVQSPNVRYTKDYIESKYVYQSTKVDHDNGKLVVTPVETQYNFKVERKVPKLGVMLAGWGGNNGSTVTGAVLANTLGLSWPTKEGEVKANYFGSVTQASTINLGTSPTGNDVFIPFKDILPMVSPNDIVFDGWDISSMNLADAMERARVFDYSLQTKLRPHMEHMVPRPAIYYPDFIAANQSKRADNVLKGNKQDNLDQIRKDIRDFKAKNSLDKVLVLWTANTERFSEIQKGINDTAENLLQAIVNNESEVSPSTVMALACILEGVTYINGSPQNTFVPGVLELAEKKRVFIAGDDFKSGQTKVKSVLVDFLVSAGIKPVSIVSYNHLGNNDGKNLSAPKQFRSKEISKSNVVDDMVDSNRILYDAAEKPDHCVVIKYVPYVGDSKRAMDEYTSEIMMGGRNTLVLHNTCEDSLLASPLILDLVILAELCERITFRVNSEPNYQKFNSILSILSYLCKAPLVPKGAPLVNALFRQRMCMENIFRACIGLAPVNNMQLEHKHEHLTVRNPIVGDAAILKAQQRGKMGGVISQTEMEVEETASGSSSGGEM